MIKKGYIRGDLMRIIKNLFFVSLVAYSSAFAADLETETKNDKKSGKKFYKLHKNHKNDKKLYDFTKNSALEGIDLEKSPKLKSHKKSDKKLYKQLAKNNIAEGVSVPIIDFNKTLSFGPYFERTKSKKTQYMDGGLMIHIRF
ncbi:hypothetical protein [Helicobacter pylori]|uniref:hypothetical protein n=1 Tax=Helicobacter pylori TaxID=210 RepID=UPI001ABAF684|nr:hypothetical protein [Helicobacter pylori]WRE18208.1 hypothetical protein KVE44_02550 [Helicobacter pylori]